MTAGALAAQQRYKNENNIMFVKFINERNKAVTKYTGASQ